MLTRRTLPLAALLALVAAVWPAAAFDIFNMRNSLIQFALEQISTEDFTITAEEAVGAEEGGTELLGLSIADREGVWFTAERIGLEWNARRILSAELEITRMFAEGVEVLRQPEGSVEVKEDAAIAEDDGEAFAWPRSPIATRIDEMRLERVVVAAGVISGQSIAFDATGSARDEGDEQALRLALRRTDAVSGRIDLDYLRDFAAGTLRANLRAEEAAGGLVAELAGLPEDSGSRVRLEADGPLTNWALDFAASTDRIFEAGGEATVDLEGPLAIRAGLRVVPGPDVSPELGQVLGREARLSLDIVEEAGVIEIREGHIRSPALEADATGRYVEADASVDLDISLEGRAALAGLAEGVAFDGFGFSGRVEGLLDDLTATGEARLDGLETEPADLGAARLQTEVRISGEIVEFNIDGRAERLRIDRLGPDLLGQADLTALGVFDGTALSLVDLSFRSIPLSIDASGRLVLPGETDPGRAALDYALAAPELAPLAAAYDADATGSIEVSGRVEGPLDAVALSGEARFGDLSLEGERYGEVTLGHAITAGETVEGSADLAASGSRYGPIAADVDFALAGQRLDLPRLSAQGLGATIDGALVYALDTGLATGEVQLDAPDLGPLAAVADAPVTGAVSGTVTLTAPAGTQAAALDLQGREIAALGASLARLDLVGTLEDALGAPRLSATLAARQAAYAADGIDARVATIGGEFAGTDLAATPDLDLDLTLTEAEGVGAALGQARLDAEITDATTLAEVVARLEAEGLAYPAADARVARLTADLTAADALSELPTARLDATAEGLGGAGAEAGRADLTATLTPEEGRAAAAVDLALAAIRAAGATIADATLSATSPHALAPAPDLAAEARIGRIDAGDASIASMEATTTVTAAGASEMAVEAAARIGAISAGTARIDGARLAARVAQALGADPRIEADLTTGAIEAGEARTDGLTARASGPLSGLRATIDTEGVAGADPVALSAEAAINAAGDPLRATVSRLEAVYAGEEIRLRAPLSVTAGTSTRLEGLDLALPGGGLTGDAALHPGGIEADLALLLDDLGIARRLADAPIAAGALDARVALDTRRGSAGGTARIAATGLRFEETIADLGALDLALDGDWDGRAAALDGRLEGPFGDPVRLTARVPLRPTGGPVPAVPEGEEIDGRVQWSGEVQELWALVPAPGHVLAGQLDLDLGIGGTLAAPAIEGSVALADGRYENLDVGTILTDLTLGSEIAGLDTLRLEARARDGAEGQVEAEVALSPDRLDARVTSAGAVLVRRDDATASVSLDIAAEGALTAFDVTGRVDIDRAEIRLVNATPPSVATLGDVRIKGAPEPEPTPPAGSTIGLDIAVRADRDIFVRGRGLDSEWSITLDIDGTAAAPRITGSIDRVRGGLSLIGTQFDLETGTVRFAGGAEIDPRINVRLQAEENGVTGGIEVTGPASDPQVGFWSRQGLPEDEVLPRILFGKPAQSLEASQAIRLASGLATLMDGSGFLAGDTVRNAVGLDVLSIDPTEDSAEVTVGKNIADDVFVGARQSIDGAESRVVVEVEVYPDVIVDTEIDQEGETSVGVRWRKDF